MKELLSRLPSDSPESNYLIKISGNIIYFKIILGDFLAVIEICLQFLERLNRDPENLLLDINSLLT